MAHFAKLDENNFVIEVHVVHDINAPTEGKGIEFLQGWSNGHPYWKQCSYNASVRKNFPGKGYQYDAGRDAFVAPKPFTSWILDDATGGWEPPVQWPHDGMLYVWDEEVLNWRKV